jgi:hypothetical protein
MSGTPSSPGHQLELAHSLANDAIRSVAMQHHRISQALPEDERFFAGQGFRQEADLRSCSSHCAGCARPAAPPPRSRTTRACLAH